MEVTKIENSLEGHVGFVKNQKIKGWAFLQGNALPLTVELYINDKFISDTVANKYRKDLKQKNIHSNGLCGFIFELGLNLPKSYKIEIKVKQSASALKNCIQFYNGYLKKSVLVIGLAKSGTTILTYKIGNSLKNAKVHFEPNGREGFSNLEYHRRALLSKNNENIVSKLIFYPNLNSIKDVKRLSSFYSKKIWIIRDPRDTIISSFFYRWNKSHNMKDEDFLIALNRTKLKESNPNSISFMEMTKGFIDVKKYINKTYLKVAKIINQLPKDWVIIKYEDFIDEKYDKLEKALNVSIDKNIQVPERLSRVVRTKAYGNWRRWFNNDDVVELKSHFAPVLNSLGYNDKDWRLDNINKLDPKEGSLYLEKIFYGSK